MPFTRVDELPATSRNGVGRPANVHPEGDELLASGPGLYLVDQVDHDGTEEGIKEAKKTVASISRQLTNVDDSIRVRTVADAEGIGVYAHVMSDDEAAAYFADLAARAEKRAAKAAEKAAAEEE